ncbi:PrgI family protein [Virgisporangium aurantiacum]|uniref:PrgI family protein n=1 Tax=Virgisporangium aurantiacum TaxID=175570 RepID=A0A8J4EAL1_9ACTN|nr:PrgI family protein [Virgisporangium aurantiacum]GIJ64887.1 hypothetical protein Vau01_124030 [Virgisporangium aurantiacum]
MNAKNSFDDEPCAARVPADVEAPDRILWGLTARQIAILAAAAAVVYLLWQTIGVRLPLPVFAVAVIPVAGAAAALALGRRDGLSLDAWLLAAIRHRRAPRRAVPANPAGSAPFGPDTTGHPLPAVLRLPATAIADDGTITVPDVGSVALVAATTVNVGLRTAGEQAAIVGAYGRWLNSLTGPVQIVVSTQRVDLASQAIRIADAAPHLPHPALSDAALDYAEFLEQVAEQRDPLCRTVTVACTAPAGSRGEAMRRAEHTGAALAAVGCRAAVVDAATATAVLTAAVDPFQPADASWPRTPPHTPVTAASWEEQV